ncbi:MAG TPA: DivIVA domain-containing protein [Actinomycetota bacterium]|nr:DivIVA domain-containing protein [Actinomycetota bacterium]
MRKKKEEVAAPAPASSEGATGTPLTPRDIQEKVFKTQAGLRGYNEREVDEFLDRITEDFARLYAENQRLRAALAAGGAAPAVAPAMATDGAGQEITSEFVGREREFLKNLATLIQSHAEAVKQDIGRARAVAPAPTAVPLQAPVPPPSAAPAPEPATVAVGEGAVAVASVATEVAMPLQQGVPEPAMAGVEASSPQESPDEQTIRELFWGED